MIAHAAHDKESPRNDHDCESDDELIIYGEPNHSDDQRPGIIDCLHMNDSQPTQLSQQSKHSHCNPNLDLILISRAERRKRRREWKERELLDEEMDLSEHSDNQDDINLMEDTFASLQALLETKASPHPSQDQQQRESTKQMEPSTDLVTRMKHKGKGTDVNIEGTNLQNLEKHELSVGPIALEDVVAPSPPDFAMYNDDSDDDPGIYTTSSRGRGTVTVTNCDDVTPKRHSERRIEKKIDKRGRDRVKRARSLPSSSSHVTTGQSHPRTKRRHRHSLESSKLEDTLSFSTTQVTHNDKMIVGLR